MSITNRNALNKIILFFLVFEMALPKTYAIASNSYQTTSAKQVISQSEMETDPLWEDFVNTKPVGRMEINFDPNDPAIDRNPYFLRGQEWKTSSMAPSKQMNYIRTQKHLQLVMPDSNKVLQINLPLVPVQSTENYVFFSLDESSDLFKKAAGANAEPGEGLFFISRTELQTASLDQQPIAFFFFPLEGQGWTGTLDSLYIPQTDKIVFSNKTTSVAIEMGDIETLMKAQKINLMLASALTIKNRKSLDASLPAPGMTAAFGLFFAGIDLQFPEKSFWKTLQAPTRFSQATDKIKDVFAGLMNNGSLRGTLNYLFPQAHAFDGLSDGTIDKIVYVGSILMGMLASSIYIKYRIPGVRKKLNEIYSHRDGDDKMQWLHKTENKKLFDVFAATTSTALQIPAVTTATALEVFLDRFVPTLAAADHTLIRRILNNSFYASRNRLKNVPVNAQTFFLGAVVLNGVDSGSLVIQYKVAVPWISAEVAPLFGEGVVAKVNQTFLPTNTGTNQLILEDTARNVLAYALSGAASFSNEARGLYLDTATKEAEAELRNKGLNPFAPENESKKTQIIEDKIAAYLLQKGLPERRDFLFDFNTVLGKIPQMLGYRDAASVHGQQSFLLSKRYGLTKQALDKSIELAKEWARTDGSEAALQALQILEETKASMSFLVNGIKNGREGLAQAKLARRRLTLLSYEGSVDLAIKYLPRSWVTGHSAEAATVSGLFFRQSLFSFISAEGNDLLFPSQEKTARFEEKAKLIALQEIQNKYPDVTATNKLNASQAFEYKLRFQMAINNLARAEAAQQKAEKYSPPKLNWIERRKHQHALTVAEQQIQLHLTTEAGQQESAEQLQVRKETLYRTALAHQVGLHIEDGEVARANGREEYANMLEKVEAQSRETSAAELANNLDVKTYHDSLNEFERAKYKQFLYANNFFQSYKAATTETEMVPPQDPAQPGRLQRLRQTEIVRNSATLTRLARAVESPFNDQAYGLGVKGFLARNFPWGSDIMATHIVLSKTVWGALSISYIFNYYMWNMHIPFGAFAVFVATSALTISTPQSWLMRAFRMQGMKPKATTASMIAYGVPYTWATFTGMFPYMLLAPEAQLLFSDYIRDPFLSAINSVSIAHWLALGTAAAIAAYRMREKPQLAVGGKAVQTEQNLAGKGVTSLTEFELGALSRGTCAGLF